MTPWTDEELTRIGEMIVEENNRRRATGEQAVYLMYDQIYWMLQFGSSRHVTPVELVPEMAAYTIFVDGISKGLAATGLRVGWAVGCTVGTAVGICVWAGGFGP